MSSELFFISFLIKTLFKSFGSVAGLNVFAVVLIKYLYLFCLLSIIEAKDISEPAFYWLILRVIHGLCYLLGIAYVRTLAWLGSLGCLIVMGLALI